MKTADQVFAVLLVFIPLTAYFQMQQAPATLVFTSAALAIVPLAKYIGEATEELTRYVGAAVGGLLNATFGNAPELIIALFALRSGLLEVVKASIIGSILANLLLGLGLALFLGGFRHRQQKFNPTAAKAAGSTLLLVILALIMPATFIATTSIADQGGVEALSLIVAALLIVAYVASLIFSLWNHQHLYLRQAADYMPRWSATKCLVVLFAAMLATAYVSDILVGAIEPIVTSLGWTPTFIGVVFLAIVGNAAEYAAAIRVALKDNIDLALQIAIGSATQIAMFVAPVLVILSYFFGAQLDLVFSIFELTALVLSVLVVNAVVEDGESNWFEGLQLLVAYTVIAAAFFLHP